MRMAFAMSCIAQVEVFLPNSQYKMSIPEANTNCIAYDQDFINWAFEFYGNSKEDNYEGHTKISLLLKMYKGISLVGILRI